MTGSKRMLDLSTWQVGLGSFLVVYVCENRRDLMFIISIDLFVVMVSICGYGIKSDST